MATKPLRYEAIVRTLKPHYGFATAHRIAGLLTKETSMDDNELLQTTDAVVWAREFCARFGNDGSINDGSGAIDEGLMIAWFANAIETGRRAGQIEVGT